MESVDGDVRLSVKLDTKTIQSSADELRKAFKNALSGASDNSDFLENTTKSLSKTVQTVSKSSAAFGNSFSAAKVKVDTTASTMLALENNVQKAENRVVDLNRQLDELNKKKTPTEEYKEISKQIQKTEKDLDKLNEKSIAMQESGKQGGKAWQENEDKIEKIRRVLDDAKIEMNELVESGKAFKIGTENSLQAEQLIKQLKVAQNEYDIAKTKAEEFQNALKNEEEQKQLEQTANNAERANEILTNVQTVESGVSQRFQSMATAISSASDRITQFNKSILNSVKSLIQHAKASKAAKNGMNNLNSVIKKGIGVLLKYGLGIRSTYILINKLRTAAKEGYKNLAGYSDEVNASISSVLSSLAKLKNQLAATFQPIVSVIVPVLNQLIAKLNESAFAVSQFFAALTGQTVVYKANDVQKQYVENLEDTAEAAEEAEKALDNYLSPLDDLNKYEEPKDTAIKATENKTDDSEDPKKMFETVAVESKFLELAKKIKEELSELFAPIKNSWDKYGATVIEKVKGTFNSLKSTIGSVHDSFVTVWTGGTGENIVDNILQTFININSIITNISDNFRTAWDSGAGLSIVQTLADTFNTILTHINNITAKTAEWSKDVNFEPLLNSLDNLLTPLQGIIDLAGEWTEKVWEKVFLPLASWAIEEAVPAALDAIGGALELIKNVGEKAGEWLGVIWDDFLEPVASWVGDTIVDFLNTLSQVLKDVSENDTAVTALLAIGTAILGIVAAIELFNIVMAVATFLAAPTIGLVTAIGIALAAIIIVIIEVITYWDTLEDFGKALWDTLKEKWSKGIEDLKRTLPVIGHFFESFLKGLKKIFSGIIKFITGKFTNNWEEAWEGIKDIFKGIWGTLTSIVRVPINIIIKILNAFISEIESKINFISGFLDAFGVDIPDWVPGIGGGHLGFNLPFLNIPRIPYLATGAVIPPNREFLAVLGDQRNGNNIEAPESLIRQIVSEELAKNSGGNNVYNVNLQVGNKSFLKFVLDEAKIKQGQTGRNPFELA